MRVPAPVLVNVEFAVSPAMTPPYVSVLPEKTSIVPSESPREIPRSVDREKFAVVASVPPFRRNWLATSDAALPSPESAAIEMVPAEMVVAPVYVLMPESVSVPAPIFVNVPLPATMPP